MWQVSFNFTFPDFVGLGPVRRTKIKVKSNKMPIKMIKTFQGSQTLDTTIYNSKSAALTTQPWLARKITSPWHQS